MESPIIYDGNLFKHLRTSDPLISVYAIVKKTKVSRQTINGFEAGNDIKQSTLTKLLIALYELKKKQP